MFEIVDSQAAGPVIKVIGVGGAGGNAINHMIEQGVEGVEFIAINTDAQVLSRNRSRNQIQLGSCGLGSGAKPEEAHAKAIVLDKETAARSSTAAAWATREEHVFALGDCAAAPWLGHEGRTVPPRAQAAHQQASHLVRQLQRRLRGQPLQPWRYRDFGSLVSLGEYSTVGHLMGGLVGGNLWVEGLFARTMYLSLYKMHELALHGLWKTALGSTSRLLTRRTEPRVKLH